MERTSVLYQHQRVSDVNVAAVFVLGIKTISEQTFLNLYDGWFKICKSVALNHENGGLERYKTHLLVLVGISAHCQTMDVKRVLELLLEMTSFIRRNTSYLYETQFVLFLIVYLAVCSQTSLNTLKPDAKLLLQEFRLQFLSVLVPQQSHLYRCFQSHSVFTLKSKKELWRKWFDIEHQEDLNRNWSSGDIEDALAFRRQFKAISSCIPLQSLQQWPHMKAFLSTQHQPPSCRLLTTKKKLILLMQPPPHIEETPAQRMSEMLPDELLMRIFLFLSAKRLCRIASVNKQCHELICDKQHTENLDSTLNEIRNTHHVIIKNIARLQERTKEILQEHEKDIRSMCEAKLEAQKDMQETNTCVQSNDDVSYWVGKTQQLNVQVEWGRELATRLNTLNQNLMKENQCLKIENSTQKQECEFLMKQIVNVKKENGRLRSHFEETRCEIEASKGLKKSIMSVSTSALPHVKPSEWNFIARNTQRPASAKKCSNDMKSMGTVPDTRYKEIIKRLKRLLETERQNLQNVRTLYTSHQQNRTELENLIEACVNDIRLRRNQPAQNSNELDRKERKALMKKLCKQERILQLLSAAIHTST
ncbi:hypothetical protein ABG067_004016 [Albugo candida]